MEPAGETLINYVVVYGSATAAFGAIAWGIFAPIVRLVLHLRTLDRDN